MSISLSINLSIGPEIHRHKFDLTLTCSYVSTNVCMAEQPACLSIYLPIYQSIYRGTGDIEGQRI